jgi:hypothetical protein
VARLIDPVEEQSRVFPGGTHLLGAASLGIVPGLFRADIGKNGQGIAGRFRRPGDFLIGQDDRGLGTCLKVIREERTAIGKGSFARGPLQNIINKILYFAPLVRREPGDFLVK